ncbi:MAG: L-rhamnose mutarotase [Rhodothermales bacterium]
MIRKAFMLQVLPEHHAEYESRHNPIWKELEDTLKSHGVHKYSIFLNEETSQLFGYAEIESEAQWQAIATTEICQKWWAHMKDIMPTNPDNSPVSQELREVFFLGESVSR